jgi:hypothetical protein
MNEMLVFFEGERILKRMTMVGERGVDRKLNGHSKQKNRCSSSQMR